MIDIINMDGFKKPERKRTPLKNRNLKFIIDQID